MPLIVLLLLSGSAVLWYAIGIYVILLISRYLELRADEINPMSAVLASGAYVRKESSYRALYLRCVLVGTLLIVCALSMLYIIYGTR